MKIKNTKFCIGKELFIVTTKCYTKECTKCHSHSYWRSEYIGQSIGKVEEIRISIIEGKQEVEYICDSGIYYEEEIYGSMKSAQKAAQKKTKEMFDVNGLKKKVQ